MLNRLAFITILFFSALGFAQDIEPEHYNAIQGRHIGPVGNRVIAVVGVPGDDLIYYAGAASGGIWKTVDGGVN